MKKNFGLNITFIMTILLLVFTIVGCGNYLAFSTGTKFGLDISQRPDQTADVLLGYQRVEIASIPVPLNKKSTYTEDVYSVLGTFDVEYDPDLLDPEREGGLHINQLFATGMAARNVAENANMQKLFGEAFGTVIKKNKKPQTGDGS
jgi:hypothetical protein